MSDTATIVIAVIGSQIAASGLVLTVINQRLKDFRDAIDERFKGIDQRFTDLEKVFDANFETIRVEIRQIKEQIEKRRLVLP